MYRLLLVASQICLIAFILGGFVITVGQAVGIVLGDGALVETFGTTVADKICRVAGAASIFAFLRRYTREGKLVGANQDD